MNIEEIKKYIDDNGLNRITNPSNKREFVWQRFYIANYLRKNFPNETLWSISQYLGYDDHDMAIYGIKKHEELKDKKQYKNLNKRFRSIAEFNFDPKGKTLKQELLKCETLIDFHRLQKQVKEGLI